MSFFGINLRKPIKKLKEAESLHSVCVSRNREKGFARRLYYVKYDGELSAVSSALLLLEQAKFDCPIERIFCGSGIQVEIF